MSCHSHESSCCSQNQSPSHSCGCSCQACSCCSNKGHGQEECCNKEKKLLELADLAWMEVLKEKIKEHIKNSDSKIDEMAQLIANTNRERWHQKMAKAKMKEDFSKKLGSLFGCGDSKCK